MKQRLISWLRGTAFVKRLVHLVFDAKIIRIDEVSEEELWRQYDNQTL